MASERGSAEQSIDGECARAERGRTRMAPQGRELDEIVLDLSPLRAPAYIFKWTHTNLKCTHTNLKCIGARLPPNTDIRASPVLILSVQVLASRPTLTY